MNELRWILLAAGVIALALIYWQGRRRRFSALQNSHSREVEPPQLHEAAAVRRREPAGSISSLASRVIMDDLPEVRVGGEPAGTHSGPMSMEEALSTAALDRLTITQPLHAETPTLQDGDTTTTRSAAATESRVSTSNPTSYSAPRPTIAATAPRGARKIVALRIPAVTQRFSGGRLKDTFINQGLRHGRYGIYHRLDGQGAPLFSVASIVEPGTFDPATMSNEEYLGLSLFLQLPGPTDGVAAFEAMLECAEAIRSEFGAGLQGERGKALTEEAIAQMREDIADFQHLTRSASSPS